MKARTWLRGLAGVCLGSALALSSGLYAHRPAAAMLARLPDIPADRLVANLEAYVKEHPQEANGFARLARVHATICLYRVDQLREWDLHYHTPGGPNLDTQVSDKDAELHAAAALKNFAKALELDPKNALFHLNVAFFLDHRALQAGCAPYGMTEEKPTAAEAAAFESSLKACDSGDAKAVEAAQGQLTAGGAKALGAILAHLADANEKIKLGARQVLVALWQNQAELEYWKAYTLTIDADMKAEADTFGGGEPISTESAEAYERLVKLHATPSDEEKKNLATIQANRDAVAKAQAAAQKNNGPFRVRSMSPIVFSLDAAKPLNQLVDAHKMVPFDLDGDDVVEQRQWVQADTAILVWDPKCEGKITSGRQLFGNVTWWIFWNNGYEALDALDDNRDGVLTGAELTGLAVWRDANQNGVSDPGEVVPVVNVGIDAISVRTHETEDGCPANKTGLHLTNGQTLPTYDWYSAGVAK